MDTTDLIRLACETNFEYLALGNQRFEAHGAVFIVNPATARRHDANCVGLIRTDSVAEIEALLQRAETEFEACGYRKWGIDALTPAQAAARIILEPGNRSDDALVHALEGPLDHGAAARPRDGVEVREVLTEEDWQAYRELDAMWWQETSTDVLGPYDGTLHDEFLASRRLKAPATRGWFACIEGEPRAFFSSWPGDNGVGIIEDLYCHPEYRHRDLATALIGRTVADCRERGAGPVIINSDPYGTPKRMYAAMGFQPLFIHRSLTMRREEGKDATA